MSSLVVAALVRNEADRTPGKWGGNGDYVRVYVGDGKARLEHVLIAESALGKSLPEGAEVHHINGNRSDNSPSNLVICQDRAYHRLLHRRQRALELSGNANWLMCVFCKTWDDPLNMYVKPNGRYAEHRACRKLEKRDKNAARRRRAICRN
jgi:hypothetical protein